MCRELKFICLIVLTDLLRTSNADVDNSLSESNTEKKTADLETDFPEFSPLDYDETILLRWQFEEKYITFNLVAPSSGWIGLGLSQTGSMNGADLILMGISNDKPYVLDAHAERNGVPDIDTTQNVEIISGWENGTHTSVTFKRKRVTCDGADMSIKEGTYRVLWAYGSEDLADGTASMADYHGSNRGAKSLRLINPLSAGKKDFGEDTKFFDVRADNRPVPARDTFYLCKIIELPEATNEIYVTGYELFANPQRNNRYLHHVLVHVFNGDATDEMLQKNHPCYVDGPYKYGRGKFIGGYGIGLTTVSYPENTAMALGGRYSPKYFTIEIHYDNPGRDSFTDSSGLRFYYVEKKKEHNMGLLHVSHHLSQLFVPPGAERYTVEGLCTEDCLSRAMEKAGETKLTVMGTVLHSHAAGIAMKLRHFRDGKELKPISEDEHYDFNYQEIQIIDHDLKIQKGDELSVQCTYNTLGRTDVTSGGFAIYEEMCQAFVFYYPALELDFCSSTPNIMDPATFPLVMQNLNWSVSLDDVAYVAEAVNQDAPISKIVSNFTKGIEWTKEKIKSIELLMKNFIRLPVCHNGFANLLIDHDELFYPKSYKEYKEPEECQHTEVEVDDKSDQSESNYSLISAATVFLFVIVVARLSMR